MSATSRPRSVTITTPSLQISDIRFPPGLHLPAHTHDDPIFAVFLNGSMEVDFGTRRFDCRPGHVQVHAAGARHSQSYHGAGARILVLEPRLDAFEEIGPLKELLGRVQHFRDGAIASLARRAVAELRAADEVAPLATEALALEMLALAARLARSRAESAAPPHWLVRAEEMVHDRFRERLRIAEVAAEADVHPSTLARSFREHFGMPLGTYLRGLKLDWAAERLRTGDRSIAAIAVEAGFSDQSHFTRAFRAHTGRTPAEFREAARG